MSALKRQAAQALATYLSAQIPGIPFTAVSADYEQDATFPCGVVIPRHGQFMAWQDDEKETTSTKQLVTVGEFEGQVEIRLCGLEQPQREDLEQQVMDVLASSEFSPGVVTLQAPAISIGGTQFTHQPLVVFSLTDEDWREEMVFTSERYASLMMDAWYHVFVARDYPDINEIVLSLTHDVTSDPSVVTIESVILATDYASAVLASNPAHFWLLDPVAATAPDLGNSPVVLNKQGNPVASPTIILQETTRSQLCASGSDFFQAATTPSYSSTDPFTFMGWVRPLARTAGDARYNGAGWSVGLGWGFDETGHVLVSGNPGVILTSQSTVAIGTSVHIGITYDGATVTLYINGLPESQIAQAAVQHDAGGFFYINPSSANCYYQAISYETSCASAALMKSRFDVVNRVA